MGSGNPQIPGIKSTEENLHMDQENIQTPHSKAQDAGSYSGLSCKSFRILWEVSTEDLWKFIFFSPSLPLFVPPAVTDLYPFLIQLPKLTWLPGSILSSPVMHLLVSLLLLLLLGSAEPRRGPRSKAVERGARGHVRGRGRPGVMRRQTEVCLEYMESGEKYLDCQDRQLTTVMQDWPKDIHHLLLARNRIQVFTGRFLFTWCKNNNWC